MLFLLSPSKTQDFGKLPLSTAKIASKSPAVFMKYAQIINDMLSKFNIDKLEVLMKSSRAISENTKVSIDSFDANGEIEKQAIFAYIGQVFKGFELDKYDAEDFDFVQKHLLIMSGLYGALRPLDLIRPYRLEMKAGLTIDDSENLYAFWKEKLTDYVNKRDDKYIVNLASNEYFKALDSKKLRAKIITPVFKEKKGDTFKVVAIFAKQARGEMVNWAVKNRILKPGGLRDFTCMGYLFKKELSDESTLVFVR